MVRRLDDDWYEGRVGGRQGIIPALYLDVIKEPETPFVTPVSSRAVTPNIGQRHRQTAILLPNLNLCRKHLIVLSIMPGPTRCSWTFCNFVYFIITSQLFRKLVRPTLTERANTVKQSADGRLTVACRTDDYSITSCKAFLNLDSILLCSLTV